MKSSRDLIWQGTLLAIVVLAAIGMAWNASQAMERQHIASGFGFLNNTAGFDIVQTLVSYDETSSYARVLLVGFLNTLLVALLGIVGASVVGLAIGIGQLSSNWLLSRLCRAYVETLRNVPLLLQLFFWYFAVLRALPGPRESWSLFDLAFLNNRGLYVPELDLDAAAYLHVGALGAGFLICAVVSWFVSQTPGRSGRSATVLASFLAAIFLPVILISGFFGPAGEWSVPQMAGFDFEGGTVVLPELIALVLALSLYTASFIGEIVRAGIQGVPKGQTEAAHALGLDRAQSLRLVVIPQALRQIIPPLTSQYLNLTKNSSLAVAIAYPDLVSVFAGTALNQTGQAIEIIAITMGVYLFLSLVTSLGMNWYNRSIALTER